MNQLMKQAQAMQEKLAKAQGELATKEYTGVSGGGLVDIKINGKYEVKSIKIDSSLINKDDKEILEDLIAAAFNDAAGKIKEDSEGSMSSLLPSGFKMPF